MNCQICGREVIPDKSGILKRFESGIVHVACLHRAEERAEHEMKQQKRGE